MKTQGFKWEVKWIAQRLKIIISEVNIAVERLERAGLLDRDENGNFFDSTKGFTTDIRDGISSQAQRRFQQRSLEQAVNAVQNVDIDFRDNTSMNMTINVNDRLCNKIGEIKVLV